MMTGRYQQRFGHESNIPPKGKGMDVKEKTIADYLAGLGYRTGLIGKWHLGNTEAFYPTRRGFEAFYGLREGSRSYWYDTKKSDKPGGFHAIERNGTQVAFDGYLTDVFGAEAVRFVGAKDPRPWFLFLSFTAPHGPMHATDEDLERFAHIESKKRRTYAAMVWAMDRAIGAVVDQLTADGSLDNTLIWFLSDNGGASGNASVNLPLSGHKGIKFEGGHRVPYIMHWPKGFKGGTEFHGLTSSLDILPTAVAAAGGKVEESARVDGVNLLPFLQGKQTGAPHAELYWHKLWFSAMRQGPWKLIWIQDYGNALYNLDSDLAEKRNLAATEPRRRDAMQAALDTWKGSLMEPLWREGEHWFRTHGKTQIRLIEGGD